MTRQQLLTTLKQQRQILPLLLLTAYCIDAIITAVRGTVVMAGVTYDYELTIKHYIAFGAIGINFSTYFFLRQFYKYTFGLTVAVGLFNLVIFSALQTTSSFGIGSLIIGFQPSAFWAGLLAYIINFKRVNEFMVDNLASKQTPEERERIDKARFTEVVKKFKQKYDGYSAETLTEIVTANKYVPEALEAARQLLKDRQANENAN
ncbi:hypothetical protein B0A58_08805 [Flavobacterium branchiophilum NBRC 15030 = ATCC 35035]|uniref:Uncharacterized protein n=1 Tax=Flavobacterium branchiophilum TaxID=55197 RepID=A0A543G4G7_9FLAO|nr:hypothetical protein [Flavobacterium branchiophilum]OXA75362.1 hypothetical protein B0A58_08805 [Flavobacterium branchiophilum NBRC 15030 = ATCC 35035]TQM40914.1 hypothetical protein BC670_1833 [Flavobacterium branchiophilum]GEM56611.1 hypothetical protein FB1_28320 [Flavobacterium branchiophilum NBRC 15030 = ATCC 35035]